MKKFVLILTLISCLCPHTTHFANAKNSFYAKIESGEVYFYSAPLSNSEVFEIPKSYFVCINADANDFWQATYKNQTGYVKKEQVSLMNGNPQNPYATSTFKVFVNFSLYEAPNQTSSIKTNVNPNQSLTYYGKRTGQALSSVNNVWYYCSLYENGHEVFGYIYSGVVDQLSTIATNYETFTRVEESNLSQNQSNNYSSLSTKTKIMLVVAISVPSAMILYFLIKPSRLNSSHKRKRSKVLQRKSRHSDYYEFDEHDL